MDLPDSFLCILRPPEYFPFLEMHIILQNLRSLCKNRKDIGEFPVKYLSFHIYDTFTN